MQLKIFFNVSLYMYLLKHFAVADFFLIQGSDVYIDLRMNTYLSIKMLIKFSEIWIWWENMLC